MYLNTHKENKMSDEHESLAMYLKGHKVSRRDLLKFSSLITATLALPAKYTQVFAETLAGPNSRVPVIWMEFQGCTGDSESFLRANRHTDPLQSGVTDPSITELVLDYLSLNYHETLMVPSGDLANKSLSDTLAKYSGKYICIVEGSIPMAQNGAFCTIGGKSAVSIAHEICGKALACMALGSCAYDGGVAAAAPNPTGAVGLGTAVPNAPNLINFPGCPSNVINVVAAVVYYLTFSRWPELDDKKRPMFAYGHLIHDYCPRRPFYDSGKYVAAWGDEGHRAGWCLFMMGCKGPATSSNCPAVKWNDGTNWPIGAGHGCIGCTKDKFWDSLPPVYDFYAG
jgi:hydrogenase small subunit